MTDSIIKFDFRGHQVRVVRVGDHEEWVAKDVCEVLAYSNTRDALTKHVDEDEKGVAICDTPGGPQEMATITEPGLYKLMLRSHKPQAKTFARWVTHEVLPQIRRTGAYGVQPFDPNILTQLCQTMVTTCQTLVEAVHTIQTRSLDDNTIGTRGATYIRKKLLDYANAMAPDDKKLRASLRSAAEMDLRVAIQHVGTGRTLADIPTDKWSQVKGKLEELSRLANRVGNRQLLLVPMGTEGR